MHLPRTLPFLAAALIAFGPRPAAAQAALQAEPSAATCPDCNPPKRFWAGAAELMIVQLIPYSVSRYLRDMEWAKITFKSWGDNIKYPWQWDNNQFLNNQFSHPYHGSLYFNAGRANGYDFWESTPWAFGGSLMWELFGEVWAPSPNDLANTTLGGITLGEMLWRFSSLVLDNQATGSERTWREIGATVINPVRGFNRLVRGETARISETPPEWRPTIIQAAMDVGYRHLTSDLSSGRESSSDQAFLRFTGIYGDAFRDLDKAPFSTFQFSGTLASRSENSRTLQELNVRGNLAARPLSSNSESTLLAAFMTYEYLSNPVLDFGAQGFQGGIVHRSRKEKVTFTGEALARFNPVAAIRSDYFVTAEGRDYDYGIGLGARLGGSAVWAGRGLAQVNGGYVFLPVVSGFPGQHHLWVLGAEARGYLANGKLGFGAAFNRVWRHSRYTFNPDVDEDLTEFRLYGSITLPRWQQAQP
jgi:hypothetical protein